MPYDFTHQRVAVIGMARSGLAAADVLAARGAEVRLVDGKPAAELAAALAFAAERGIAARAGSDELPEGVDLVVTSPGVRRSAPMLTQAVERGVPVWGEIEAAYRIARAPIYAVTGTNGKTTTAALLGEMGRRAGRWTQVAGNIAAGEIALPLIRAADQAGPDDAIVAEISSFQLEWVSAFRPRVAAITNITVDHSDRQTWEEYVASKWRIFENQGEGDTAVLRSDVPRPAAGAAVPAETTVEYDLASRPGWLEEIALPGEHNRENVLAALAVGRAAGWPEEALRDAALAFRGVVHRLEYVADVAGARWYNNSMCTNNDAFARSLAAIDGPKVVIAGGVYKGGDPEPVGRAAADASVRALIAFGRSGALLADAARGAGAERVTVVETLDAAVERAAAAARPGDAVLLSPACASFDQFRDFEERGDRFKALVRALAG